MSKVGYNPFAGLQTGDSDSDAEENAVSPPLQAPNTPALAVPASPPFRVWNVEQPKTYRNAFAVKKKKGKQVQTMDNEGWVSLRASQPAFVDDSAGTSDSEQEIKREIALEALPTLDDETSPIAQQQEQTQQPLRSLLSRGTGELTAMDWAERVRASLERAEGTQKQSSDEFVQALGRLSFFRRPLQETSGGT